MKKKALWFVSTGFSTAILLAVFVYTGQKLDSHFDTGGGITAGAVILVLLLWFYQLIKIFK